MAADFFRHVCSHVPYYTVSWSVNCRWILELSPETLHSASTFQTRHQFPTSQGTDQSVQRFARGAAIFPAEAKLFHWLNWRLYSTQLLSVDRLNRTCIISFLLSDPHIRHFQQERAPHNRFPSLSGNCCYHRLLSPVRNTIASATPFNWYSSMEIPTIDSEGSRPHMTALSLQQTGPRLYKLYTISHPAQNIIFPIFSCTRWSYRCVQWTLEVLLTRFTRETVGHTECEITQNVPNIRLAMCGLMCVFVPQWRKVKMAVPVNGWICKITFLKRRNL